MSSDATLYRCTRCNGTYPAAVFSNGKRRGRICRLCREQGNPARKRVRKWDYVAAVYKSIKVRVNMRARDSREKFSISLDESALRAIFRAQGNRCRLTNLPFHLPTVDELASVAQASNGIHVSLTEWAKQYVTDPRRLYRVPDLVRVSDYFPWEPSNVMLICGGLVEWYAFCKTLNMTPIEFCKHLAAIQPTINVPSPDELMNLRLDIQREEEEPHK